MRETEIRLLLADKMNGYPVMERLGFLGALGSGLTLSRTLMKRQIYREAEGDLRRYDLLEQTVTAGYPAYVPVPRLAYVAMELHRELIADSMRIKGVSGKEGLTVSAEIVLTDRPAGSKRPARELTGLTASECNEALRELPPLHLFGEVPDIFTYGVQP